MRVDLLTREYPPHVYGGAGVHAQQLARQLAELVDLRVQCFDGPRPSSHVTGHQAPAGLAGANGALQALGTDLAMAAAAAGADVVHSHTWYTNLAGHLAKLLYGVPHVVTTHSLEPLRPWKAEQLGGGYALSSFCERTALLGADRVIAVSGAMRDDVLRCYPELDPDRVVVIHNGIDTEEFAPDPGTAELRRLGVRTDRPTVACVARLTRQKGLTHLLRAAPHLASGTQLVLCVSAPDTPEIAAEFAAAVRGARALGADVVHVEEPLTRAAVRQLLSFADVFACPSVYEPLGIVNLEAMACETPVVATAVGGIPEVVADGETGLLVPLGGDGEPDAPEIFAKEFALRINALLAEPDRARRMGRAGRRRAAEHFSWTAIAGQVHDVYRSVGERAEVR
ncbi:glycogen synthase [Kitasatospora cathayae]|uniref:Glycogen synthase n=1 Tax=Kitasatospora cathayae TaxID=3004092 RepID=A0ABY7QFC7_9ACTN|nr:glycogen synthase [Kitasatospora sp. HUAS 3-15]WBP91456.1 glycogen synthase [Kitasatospora sp. HUAS 3-15]